MIIFKETRIVEIGSVRNGSHDRTEWR